MPPKLGILAGGGPYPTRLIEACRDTGRAYFVVAFENQTDPETVEDVPHAWVRLGAAGETLTHLRAADVEEITLAGRIRRPTLHALRPDARAARLFAKLGVAAFGDDGILSGVVKAFEEEEGFRVVGPETVIPEDLAGEGVYGAVAPDEQAEHDIKRGIEVAHGIGALDIGQGAVVEQGLVLAVEALEGTDAMLARCADLDRDGPGGVLVKMKKPGQERRADLPAIGVDTVKNAAAVGLRGIAVEAGGALVIDRPAVVAAADEAGLFVVGVIGEAEAGESPA